MLNGWQFLRPEELARIRAGIVSNSVFGGPWHIELQPTNLCNVDCFFCISRGGRHGESIPWPLLHDLLTRRRPPDLRMLRLTGGGDPLSYPHIQPLLETCEAEGILIENLTTNGIMLQKFSDSIRRVRLHQLHISLNETNAVRYAATMRTKPAAFDQVLAGIRTMVELRNAQPTGRRFRLWVQFFVWKESACDIARMYELGRALGADTIYLRTIIGRGRYPRIEPAQLPSIKAQLRDIIAADSRAGEYRLHLNLRDEHQLHRFTRREQARHHPPYSENFPDFHRLKPRAEYCYVGWYTTAINARGDVYPCFQYHDMRNKQVGNLATASLNAIWRGAAYRAFREQIRELILVRGRIEPSDRYHRFIEHKCAGCEGCQFTGNLASADFYRAVREDLAAELSLGRSVRALTRNAAIWSAHRLLLRPR